MASRDSNGLRVSNHILPVSSNLLGVCFLIFSLVRTFGNSETTILDDLAVVGIYVFLVSAVLSYLSIRYEKKYRSLERAADAIFISGLVLLTVTSTIMIFEVVH